MEPKLERIDTPDFEEVYKVTEKESGLIAIIAIHSTVMGPACGGVRLYHYDSFDSALTDVLKLAEGMTYKTLSSGVKLGGGKSVIIWDTNKPVPEKLLQAFAKAVNQLNGRYFTAEDVGISLDNLLVIKQTTPYTLGVETDLDNKTPSPFTAWGTFRSIQSVLYKLNYSNSFENKTVAIQGLGKVGSIIAELLFWHGAHLIVTDSDKEKVRFITKRFKAQAVLPDQIYSVPCDVFSPCAMGGSLNLKTIPQLRCKAVAGCANNQLATPECGQLLKQRNILYAPDLSLMQED